MGGEKSLNFNYMKYADQIFIGFFTPKLCHQLSKMGAKLFKNITKQKKKRQKLYSWWDFLQKDAVNANK